MAILGEIFGPVFHRLSGKFWWGGGGAMEFGFWGEKVLSLKAL
jgi:hypothetical protein